MATVPVEELDFEFSDDWHVTKFDDWSFYRHHFQSAAGGCKAVDLLAIEPKVCLWSIEVKDYRQHKRIKTIDLAQEVAVKVRDTLAALLAASVNANDASEKQFAHRAVRCSRLRVVLQLEQPAKHSKLHPRAIDPANVRQKLRQIVQAVDPHPLVVEMGRMNGLAWTVQGRRSKSKGN
jgi:hypothetical protein